MSCGGTGAPCEARWVTRNTAAQSFEIPDATQDARFVANPLVTGGQEIRFYCGAPLDLSDGSRIRALCVIDRQPRKLDDAQRQILQALARVAA